MKVCSVSRMALVLLTFCSVVLARDLDQDEGSKQGGLLASRAIPEQCHSSRGLSQRGNRRRASQPAVVLEGGEIDTGRRVPAISAVACSEFLRDLFVAVRDPQRRVAANITHLKAGRCFCRWVLGR